MGESAAGMDLVSRQRRQLLPSSAYQTMVWALVVVLVVGPLAPLVYTSLRSQPYYLPGSVWTFEPYRTLFADPLFWEAVKNTLIFAALTTVGSVTVGTAFAVLTVRTDLPGRKWIPWLLVSPIVIPPRVAKSKPTLLIPSARWAVSSAPSIRGILRRETVRRRREKLRLAPDRCHSGSTAPSSFVDSRLRRDVLGG